MKLKDCEEGMELRPVERCKTYPLDSRKLIIKAVINPTTSNDPRTPGITFQTIFGTYRPECFYQVKKPDKLEKGDFFICSIGYKYEVLARAYDDYTDLTKYFVKELKTGSIKMYSEKSVQRGTILYEGEC